MRSNNIINKIIIVFIIITNLFLLTGCWNYAEIDKLINVASFAVDKGENGKKYHVSAEIINIGKEDKGQITASVVESDGDTLFDAIRNIITISSKKLYFGHSKVLIIGEDVAKDGISQILDLLSRNHETRITMNVIIAKGCSAKDILMTEGVTTPIVGYEIDSLLIATEKNVGKTPMVQVYEIIDEIKSEGISTIASAVELTKVEDYDSFKSSGSAVFDNDKLIGFLNQDETKSLLFVKNKINNGIISVEADDNKNSFIAVEIYESKTKFKPQLKNNKLSATILIETTVDVGEIATETDYINNEKGRILIRQLERKLTYDITQLTKKAQTEFGSDILGMGLKIYQQEPDLWEKYQDNWTETFKNMEIDVKCKITLKGSGTTNKPLKVGE